MLFVGNHVSSRSWKVYKVRRLETLVKSINHTVVIKVGRFESGE
jgi:hypothetical protein